MCTTCHAAHVACRMSTIWTDFFLSPNRTNTPPNTSYGCHTCTTVVLDGRRGCRFPLAWRLDDDATTLTNMIPQLDTLAQSRARHGMDDFCHVAFSMLVDDTAAHVICLQRRTQSTTTRRRTVDNDYEHATDSNHSASVEWFNLSVDTEVWTSIARFAPFHATTQQAGASNL